MPDHEGAPACSPVQGFYGALTCCCWSGDGKYIAAGGEDDLVTWYSLQDRWAAGGSTRAAQRGVAWGGCLSLAAGIPLGRAGAEACSERLAMSALAAARSPITTPGLAACLAGCRTQIAWGQGHSSFVGRVAFDPFWEAPEPATGTHGERCLLAVVCRPPPIPPPSWLPARAPGTAHCFTCGRTAAAWLASPPLPT